MEASDNIEIQLEAGDNTEIQMEASDNTEVSEDIKSPASIERAVKHRRVSTRMGNTAVRDHFSLSNPSSNVAFAEDEAILFVDNLEQVVLEKKTGDDHITAKQATVSSPGLVFLRSVYTLVATLMSGLLFVFCIQLVLFLFLGVAIESGEQTTTRVKCYVNF